MKNYKELLRRGFLFALIATHFFCGGGGVWRENNKRREEKFSEMRNGKVFTTIFFTFQWCRFCFESFISVWFAASTKGYVAFRMM